MNVATSIEPSGPDQVGLALDEVGFSRLYRGAAQDLVWCRAPHTPGRTRGPRGVRRPRGREVRRDCGPVVARRTVVVHLESASARFRDRSPSLPQGVVFVSRFSGDRYRVWRVIR